MRVLRAKPEHLALALAFALYCSAGPLRLFLQNRFYFSLDLPLVVSLCVGVFLVLFLPLLVLSISAPNLFHKLLSKVLLFGLISFFVYDTFLFTFVPELDGETKAVPTRWLYLLDLCLLAVVVVVFSTKILKQPRRISAVGYFLILLLLGQVAVSAFGQGTGSEVRAVGKESSCRLSSMSSRCCLTRFNQQNLRTPSSA